MFETFYAVGGQETEATFNKSQSFAADIWLNQMENNMNITKSKVCSLTLGSLFIIHPSFLIFNHNRIGLDCIPPQTLCDWV